MSNQEVLKQIEEDVKKHPVVVYMKGDRKIPMCGFSKAVVDVFDNLGVKYETRDVLTQPGIREGIKAFTQWPTIPQVFVNGKFLGGCDIIREMYQNGELENLVKPGAK